MMNYEAVRSLLLGRGSTLWWGIAHLHTLSIQCCELQCHLFVYTPDISLLETTKCLHSSRKFPLRAEMRNRDLGDNNRSCVNKEMCEWMRLGYPHKPSLVFH